MPTFTAKGAARIARQTVDRERESRGGLSGRPSNSKTPRIGKRYARLTASLGAATDDGTDVTAGWAAGVLMLRTSTGWTSAGGIPVTIWTGETGGTIASGTRVQVAWIDGRWTVDVASCPT